MFAGKEYSGKHTRRKKNMKNVAMGLFCAAFFMPLIVFQSCASGAPVPESGAVFMDVEGKEWLLSEVRSAGGTVRMDREKLEADGFSGIYTISFQEGLASNEGRVSGMGAPNRFFGPFTAGNNRSLSLGNLASTMMMAFREPDGLREHEYFGYLSGVTRWDLRGGRLELYSSGSNRDEVVLVFDLSIK